MRALTFFLIVLGVIAFAASLLAGQVWLPPEALLDIVNDPDSMAAIIVREIRLPRSVLALVTGATLGLAGAVLQGLRAIHWPSPDCWVFPAARRWAR